MKENKEGRSAWIKMRVTPDEKKLIESKASAQGQTVTDFLRQRALDYQLRISPLEKERIRQLARIGSNMNQIPLDDIKSKEILEKHAIKVKKQQLELDMEKQNGSKLGKEYAKAVHCHYAYLTYLQSISREMPAG